MTPEEQKRIVDETLKQSKLLNQDFTPEEKLLQKLNEVEKQVYPIIRRELTEFGVIRNPETLINIVAEAIYQLFDRHFTKEETQKILASYIAFGLVRSSI